MDQSNFKLNDSKNGIPWSTFPPAAKTLIKRIEENGETVYLSSTATDDEPVAAPRSSPEQVDEPSKDKESQPKDAPTDGDTEDKKELTKEPSKDDEESPKESPAAATKTDDDDTTATKKGEESEDKTSKGENETNKDSTDKDEETKESVDKKEKTEEVMDDKKEKIKEKVDKTKEAEKEDPPPSKWKLWYEEGRCFTFRRFTRCFCWSGEIVEYVYQDPSPPASTTPITSQPVSAASPISAANQTRKDPMVMRPPEV
jgi:hypothetical protein